MDPVSSGPFSVVRGQADAPRSTGAEDGALRAAYETESRPRAHRGASAFCLIAAMVILATIPLDHVRFPHLAGRLLAIRLAGVAALAMLLGLLRSAIGRRHPRALGVLVAATSGGIVDALVLATGGESSPINVSLTFVLVGVSLLIPWPAG